MVSRWARLSLLGLLVAAAPPVKERAQERELMVLDVLDYAEAAGTAEEVGRLDRKVLRALREVPRHLFVPEEMRSRAYLNEPLPIGYDQTISQPFIVALMTDKLEVGPEHKVLEVGTGSGYQAAILSGLVKEVYTIEIVEPLATRAAKQLEALGYSNVHVRAGDGYAGWPEQAPFDRIIVTAGANEIPQPLIDQLRPGGRMVIPVGRTENQLQLTVVTKNWRGRVSKRELIPVRFVPLVRAKS